jgi:IclR family acetate operon transcriptional repressor
MREIPVAVVKKALDLLEMVVFDAPAGEGLALSELARRMEMPQNSARNILKSMIACGFVEQSSEAKYIAGPKCHRIGRWNRLISETTAQAIQAHLAALTAEIEEATVFATLRGGNRVVLSRIEASQAIQVRQALIQNERFYSTPTGRVMTAYASPDEFAQIIARQGIPGASWDGIDNEDDLRAAGEVIRTAGESVIVENQVVAFARPVLGQDGEFVGALGCYAPQFRCPESSWKKIRQAMELTVTGLEQAWENF